MRQFGARKFMVLALLALTSGCKVQNFFSAKDPDGKAAEEKHKYNTVNRAVLQASVTRWVYGLQPVNALVPITVLVRNTAIGDATNVAASFTGSSAFGFCTTPGVAPKSPGTGGTCQDTIAGKADCTLVLCFSPDAIANFSGRLNLGYTSYTETSAVNVDFSGAGANIVSLRIKDAAATPGATFSNLGTVPVNAVPFQKIFDVEYFGAFPATGVNIAVKSGTFSILSTTCGSSVSTSCQLVVRQNATQVGSFNGRFEMTYSNGSYTAKSIYDATVSFAALPIPSTLDVGAINFGQVAYNGEQDVAVTVTRSGTLPAMITSATFNHADFTLAGAFPGAGGTCALNVPFSTPSCTIAVRYHPAAGITTSGTVVLSFNNGAGVTSSSTGGALSGTGWQTSQVSVGSANFGKVLAGGSANLPVTITRTGIPAIKFNTVTFSDPTRFSFVGGPYPGIGGTCPDLGVSFSGASCTVMVRFTPPLVQSYSGTLQFSYLNGVSNVVSNAGSLTGQGGDLAAVTIDPLPSSDYGTVSKNFPVDRTFTLRNTASSSVNTTLAFSGLSAPFSILTNNCGAALAGGAFCTIVVRFLPTAEGGFLQVLAASYSDGQAAQQATRTFTGVGTFEPTLVVNDAPFADTVIGNTRDLAVTIKYYGGGASHPAYGVNVPSMPAPYTFTNGSYPGGSGGGDCPADIIGDCTLQVRFTPSASGATNRSATLKYTKSLVGPPPETEATISFTGNGQNAAVLSIVQGPSYSFGDTAYNSVTNASFTLRNAAGGAQATSIGATGAAAPLTYLPGTCAATLAAGASCTFTLRFSPTALLPSIAPLTNLVFTYANGINLATATVTLAVTGTSHPEGALSVGSINFGDVAVGAQSATVSLTVTNTGTSNVSAVTFSTVAAPFTLISSLCPSTLSIGASCTASFRFDPTAAGLVSQTLTVSFDDNGTPRSASGTLAAGGTLPIQLSANGEHTCELNRYRDLRCFGNNEVGQLGTGDKVGRGNSAGQVAALPPISLGTGRKAKKVVTGYWHTCAILDDDSTKCFGGNTGGQLGAKSSAVSLGGAPGEMGDALVAVDFGTSLKAVDLVAGYAHNCALLNNGQVKCWGLNAQGQLGYGDTLTRGLSGATMGNNLPVVDLAATAVKLSVGGSDTCAILANGAAKCFGDNFFGQLATGDWEHRGDGPNEMGTNLAEIALDEASPVQSIASGGAFRIFVLGSGTLAAIGRNDSSGNFGKALCQNGNGIPGLCGGQYGFDLPAYGRASGQRVADPFSRVDLGSAPLAQVVAGNTHVCARTQSNQVKCWGDNAKGQLGIGSTQNKGGYPSDMGNSMALVSLGAGFTVREIVSGSFHVCAIGTNEKFKCWGDNRSGQLGLGDTANRGDNANEMGDNLAIVPTP